MKRCHLNIAADRGFTLIEVIATIIIMGILAAFFVHYMGTALDYSWESVDLVAGEAEAEGKMEQIIAQYVLEMNLDPDGANALNNLKSKIENGDYNSDSITVDYAYIEFDENGDEQPAAESELLKVIVRAPGNDLTAILPKSRWKDSDPIIEY